MFLIHILHFSYIPEMDNILFSSYIHVTFFLCASCNTVVAILVELLYGVLFLICSLFRCSFLLRFSCTTFHCYACHFHDPFRSLLVVQFFLHFDLAVLPAFEILFFASLVAYFVSFFLCASFIQSGRDLFCFWPRFLLWIRTPFSLIGFILFLSHFCSLFSNYASRCSSVWC